MSNFWGAVQNEAMHRIILAQLSESCGHGCRNNEQIIFSDTMRVIMCIFYVNLGFPACYQKDEERIFAL